MINNLKLFEEALSIKLPWKLKKINFDKEEGRIDVYLNHVVGSKLPCKCCGKMFKLYDTTKEQTWRHLNFFQYKCYIHCKVPRTNCDEHGISRIKVPWSRSRSDFTLLFDAFIMELVSSMTVNEISQLVDEHDTKLWRIITYYVNQARAQEDYSLVQNIGIDETSSKRGHNYVTLFVNLDNSKVIYATEGKDSSTVNSFNISLKLHNGNPEAINNICCDMSPAFIKGIKENFPKANITYDKFHVMKTVNEAIDKVRCNERATADALKKTRYIWLKNPENLTKKQKETLTTLSKTNLKTVRAYNLKLSLKEFWVIGDKEAAENYLKKWFFWATHSRLEPMIEAAYFIKRHWQGIIQYTESRINNAVLEGINSVVQTIKREARGFRNVDNYITAIYLNCSDLTYECE